jgi:hypothetical protein
MRSLAFIILFPVAFFGLSSCGNLYSDQTGPLISDLLTSGNVLVISDCQGTSVTISAKVSDPSGVEKVLLWYRTATDQKYVSTTMDLQEGDYKADLKGPDFLGRPYGTLEFYITAQDQVGNLSKSAVNQSIQFLPCVSN